VIVGYGSSVFEMSVNGMKTLLILGFFMMGMLLCGV
jgi:hypothetical protein